VCIARVSGERGSFAGAGTYVSRPTPYVFRLSEDGSARPFAGRQHAASCRTQTLRQVIDGRSFGAVGTRSLVGGEFRISISDGSRGTILIADQDGEARALLGDALRKAGWQTAEVEKGDDALDVAQDRPLRLAVLEVTLPGLSGYEVCHQLKEKYGDGLPIILISAERTEPFDRAAGILIGADDYVVKPFALDELLARVRRLVRHTTPLPPVVAAKLTARELEVLRLLADGLEAAEIATRLVISPRTVGTHLENIMRKLRARNRAQVVALAYREDLVTR
jgi:DNA-binding NarL/FixJ family response regulator